MRKGYIHLLLFIFSLCLAVMAYAQRPTTTTTGSVMRSNGKIYVVMAICITILVGLILYVISIDRKIKKIEKQD
jgi:hypothetical protein